MIVDDLDAGALSVSPDKADTPLIVDPNAVLTGSLTSQHFQTIGRRYAQIVQALGGIQHSQLATGNCLNLYGQVPRHLTVPDAFGFLVCEATDHVRV